MTDILVLTTGGTIGALPYDDITHPPVVAPMPQDGRDFVREALIDPVFSFAKTRCVSVEPRDSKLIDDAYLEGLLKQVVTAPEDKILITYGTDRILRGATFFYGQCATNPALKNKTIVLTGAMIPISNGAGLDGYRNMEFALRFLQSAESVPGTFIVLCDYENPDEESGAWNPRLYPHQPEAYEKICDSDPRYHRLRRVLSA